MANVVEIRVRATSTGLRGEIKRDVAAAAAGTEIKVPIRTDDPVALLARVQRSFAGNAAGLGLTIPVGADTDRFRADIQAAITGSRGGISVPLGADGSGLRADLDRATRTAAAGTEITIPVKVDTRGSSDLGRFATTAAQLAPFILPAVAAIGTLSGALAAVPAMAAGAAFAVGALAVGFTGIAGTVKSYSQAQDSLIGRSASLAASQAATAQSLVTADRAVADARRDVRAAHDSAAAGIRAALGGVTSAQTAAGDATRDELDARQDLNRAYADATRRLDDLRERVSDYALTQQDAALAVAEAQDRLNQVNADGDALDSERMRAVLGVAQARERLADVERDGARSAEDLAAAERGGVDGSREVVTAQRRVEDAHRAVMDTRAALAAASARVDEARAVGAQRVERADRAVTDAQVALRQATLASAAAAESQAGSMARFRAELNNLAPSAAATVLAVIALGPAWRDLRLDVQQQLFAGLDTQVRSLGANTLPVLRTGLSGVAGTLNEATSRAAEFVTSRAAIEDWGRVLGDTALAGDRLADSVEPLLQIITDVTVVGASFLPGVADGFARSAQSAADFVREARESGQLRQWIQAGIDAVGQLWQVFTNLVVIISQVTTDVGPGLLGLFLAITGTVRWINENLPGAVPIIMGVVAAVWLAHAAQWAWNAAMSANPIGIVIVGVGALAGWLIYMWHTSESFRAFWIGLWQSAAGAVEGAGDRFARTLGSVIGFFLTVERVGGRAWDGFVGGARAAFDWSISAINAFINGLNLAIRGINVINPFADIPSIPNLVRLAQGGIAGGLAIVGERGPELVRLPQGSSVTPAGRTRDILNNPGATGNQRIILEVNTSGSRLDDLLGELITRYVRVRGGDVQAVLGA